MGARVSIGASPVPVSEHLIMKLPRHLPESMRRVVFALSFVLFGSAAQAEWISLGRTDAFRVYIDQKPTQRNGDLVQIWQIMDFTSAQWVDARTVVGSIKNLIEYDCKQARFRTLFVEAYSEQMGDGRMVASESLPDSPWEVVEPGGTAEKSRQAACSKR